MRRLLASVKLERYLRAVRKRPVFVVRRIVGRRGYGYWLGSRYRHGHSFTRNPERAMRFISEQHATTEADNSMLYKHATYRVERLQNL
jgi:hypothetical protein